MKNIFFISFAMLVSSMLYAKTDLDEAIVSEYLKVQKEFSDQSCKPGTDAAFQELNKKYRGDGNFIPTLLDDKFDLKTIKNFIPVIQDKSLWIQSQIEFVQKIKDFKKLKYDIDRLENNLSLLLDANKEYYQALDKTQQLDIKVKAGKQFQQLLKELILFKNQVPFLLSFKFPINHLSLRAEYEKLKNQNNKDSRSRANSIYFFRKIVQDGAYDENLIKGDAVIRAAFDTLYLSLNKEPNRSFLTDIERVDLQYVLSNFKKILLLKPDIINTRLTEWKLRNERTLTFYQSLVEDRNEKIKISAASPALENSKISEESQIKDVANLLEERARALYILKDFVLTREASTYEFWSHRSELLQSLFAIETILYSEVGLMDSPDALERHDVTQVVINRSENSNYNILTNKDVITKYLSPNMQIKNNTWLNVFLKEGEFSFTYFYIPGNFHIYCPDMSRTGQFLRRENVRIALELLNKPRKNFTALRYFSRMSMFGRIEMDSLWDDFTSLPEVPGNLVRHPAKINKLFKEDRYKFLYNFTNENLNKNFLVVDIKGKTYVVDAKNTKQIYYYRNPNQFKYFSLLK